MTSSSALSVNKAITWVVIPARLASTRLPRKLLLDATGKPLIQHTYETAIRCRGIDRVVVAADSPEIAQAVQAFGGHVEMTDPECPSGTDRVAEVARRYPQVDLIVNLQGDEPELQPETVEHVVALMHANPAAFMATLATPIRGKEMFENPACVKVVCDSLGRAIYFSRSPIPHPRTWDPALLTAQPPRLLQHLGLYVYRRQTLLQFAGMAPSPLEQIECLEQLRVLEAGHEIRVGLVHEPTRGIDTPEDYAAFVERFRKR